jgi:hypothetical protein
VVDRLSRYAPLTGVLYAVVAVVGIAVGEETLKSTASGPRVILHALAHRSTLEASDILFAIAFLVLVLFAGALRSYLRRTPGNDGLAALVLAGAVVMGVAAIMISGIEYGLVHHAERLSPDMARTLNFLTNEMFVPILAGAFILGVSAGLAIIRGAALPVWLGWVAIVLGIVALIPPIGFGAFIGFVIWSVIVGILIFIRYETPAPAAAPAAAAAP